MKKVLIVLMLLLGLVGYNVGGLSQEASERAETYSENAESESLPEILTLTDVNFQEKTSSGIALIDFWAEWCSPCKKFDPVLKSVAEEAGSKVLIGKVNVDDCDKIAKRFSIDAIPTIILMKDGKEIQRIIGYQSKKTIIDAINKVAANVQSE